MEEKRRTFMQHWPIMLLALVVIVIFLAVLVSFQVKETEVALLKRLGKTRREYGPGLHLRLPWPIDEVWRHDSRLQCYELEHGQIEQIQTADDYQIIVTTYVLWRVGDAQRYMTRVATRAEAEHKLDDVVRSSRKIVLARHNLDQLINVDPSQVRIAEIEQEMLESLQSEALEEYGIDVTHIGIKKLGFPELVSTKVFERMRSERNRKSEKYRAEGRRDAQIIRAQADLKASEIRAEAQAEAIRIRAEGDRRAAEYYAAFRQDPQLAAFLRKLDSLRQTLSSKTTLVLSTKTPPFDILLPDATNLKAPTRDDSAGQ